MSHIFFQKVEREPKLEQFGADVSCNFLGCGHVIS